MRASDPDPAPANELAEVLPATEETGPGLWPGFAPLELGDSERLSGRERELERLVRLFKRPQSGRTPLVWLTGDAGVGKTSLVMAGLLPRLREDAGGNLEWIRITPDPGTGPREMIDAIVVAILKRSVSEEGDAGLDLDGRRRQFGLLMDQDGAEAMEYLAGCYRKDAEAAPEQASQQNSGCLIFIDQWERMTESGELPAPNDGPPTAAGDIESLVSFLIELSFAGCFPCLVAVRALDFSAVRAAEAGAEKGSLGSEIPIGPLELEMVRSFFESAPSPRIESGSVIVKPKVLNILFSKAEEGSNGNSGALPFVSESLRRCSASDPLAGEIRLEDVRWIGGIRQVYAEVAESVVSWFPEKRKSFFALMAALHSAGPCLDGKRETLKTDSIPFPYHRLFGDPALMGLVDALVDSRVLSVTGPAVEEARVSWTLPNAILKWERAVRWLEENDRLLANAARFEKAREDWESERRTPVKLLHSTRSLSDARELLAYHQRREILSDDLTAYLEESVRFEELLGVNWRRRRWLRVALIAGGVLLAIGLVALAATSG